MAIIQFSFAFHALKTGRDQKWIWIIILAPVVGCLAYYFMEVFPHSREERTLRKRIHDIAKALNPDGELKRRTEEVSHNASVDNRAALADECLEKGHVRRGRSASTRAASRPVRERRAHPLRLRARVFLQRQPPPSPGDLAAPGECPSEIPARRGAAPGGARARGDRRTSARSRSTAAAERYVGFEAKFRYATLLKRLGREQESASSSTSSSPTRAAQRSNPSRSG
jgi:hypothetical protein